MKFSFNKVFVIARREYLTTVRRPAFVISLVLTPMIFFLAGIVGTKMQVEDAVAHAIARTAGTITSAALVMVGVFALFASVRLLPIKQLGFGLAVAVFLDATIVRAVLLPAAMKLLGDWNWYLPRWLEWLPTLEPEESRSRVPRRRRQLPLHN